VLIVYRDGASGFVIIFFVYGTEKKTSQCTGTILDTLIEHSNLMCNVIPILLPYHLSPLAGR